MLLIINNFNYLFTTILYFIYIHIYYYLLLYNIYIYKLIIEVINYIYNNYF